MWISSKKFEDRLRDAENQAGIRARKQMQHHVDAALQVPGLRKKIEELQAEMLSVKREQTEADLLFVSMKIVQRVLNPKDHLRTTELQRQQLALQAKLQQLAPMQAAPFDGSLMQGVANWLGGAGQLAATPLSLQK